MAENDYPQNLNLLHDEEESMRARVVALVKNDHRLLLHFVVTERAMDVLDILRQVSTEDEDLKAVQMLGLRVFNALASAVKLMLSGYSQASAMLLRDVLETVFLVSLFRTDRDAIERWRTADAKTRWKEFKPIEVRKALDGRDGFESGKRGELYQLFSKLAGHPSMEGFSMLRPAGMDARNGPFIDPTALEATASELGRLAIQVGGNFDAFFPQSHRDSHKTRRAFAQIQALWLKEFYSAPT